MAKSTKNYVNGEWIVSETGETIAVEDPASPNKIVPR